jgi:hypothetical protein
MAARPAMSMSLVFWVIAALATGGACWMSDLGWEE